MTSLRQRGVSLIEALVAMAVMAFGMLAVVGLQVTLRANGDLSKQRAEASRIAQQSIEGWRAFVALEATPGQVDFQDLVSIGSTAVPGINATYFLTRTVTPSPGGSNVTLGDFPKPMKTLAVKVEWTDRNGVVQQSHLNTVIAGVAPDLAGSLALPTNGVLGRQPMGRSPDIPFNATDIGGGRSAFMPPQAAGGAVVWVFNNLSAVMTTCAILDQQQPLTAGNITNCNGRAQLLQGFVNFASTAAQADATQAVTPTGAAFAVEVRVMRTLPAALTVAAGTGCFTAQPVGGQSNVVYYCAVPVSADLVDPPIWSGYAIVTSALLPVAPVVGELSICRYTTQRNDNAIANIKHPRVYSAVGTALTQQNFLVVKVVANSSDDCPNGVPLPVGTTTYPQPQTPP